MGKYHLRERVKVVSSYSSKLIENVKNIYCTKSFKSSQWFSHFPSMQNIIVRPTISQPIGDEGVKLQLRYFKTFVLQTRSSFCLHICENIFHSFNFRWQRSLTRTSNKNPFTRGIPVKADQGHFFPKRLK